MGITRYAMDVAGLAEVMDSAVDHASRMDEGLRRTVSAADSCTACTGRAPELAGSVDAVSADRRLLAAGMAARVEESVAAVGRGAAAVIEADDEMSVQTEAAASSFSVFRVTAR